MQLFKRSLCSPNSNVASGFVCSLGGGCHLGFRAIVLIEEADIGKKKKKREIRRAYEVGIFFQAWQWLVRLG